MSRFFQNGLAAFAAITIVVVSFGAVVSVPTGPAFAAVSIITHAIA